MKIYIIGYMGSGKSTVGKLLADKLSGRDKTTQFDFIDFDTHIEKETGKTITEIFDMGGEDKFRIMEHEHLKKLLIKNNVVIALGGGTPCFYNNIDLINNSGTSVYFEMDAASLVKRLSEARNKRPLIRDLNEIELKYFIEANLEKRKQIYRQAHFSIPVSQLSAEEAAEDIMRRIMK